MLLTQPPDHTFAAVTPTYLPDLARRGLLVESIKRIVPIPHYLIVDRCEGSAFAHLQSGQRRPIESEEILGIVGALVVSQIGLASKPFLCGDGLFSRS